VTRVLSGHSRDRRGWRSPGVSFSASVRAAAIPCVEEHCCTYALPHLPASGSITTGETLQACFRPQHPSRPTFLPPSALYAFAISFSGTLYACCRWAFKHYSLLHCRRALYAFCDGWDSIWRQHDVPLCFTWNALQTLLHGRSYHADVPSLHLVGAFRHAMLTPRTVAMVPLKRATTAPRTYALQQAEWTLWCGATVRRAAWLRFTVAACCVGKRIAEKLITHSLRHLASH